MSFCAEKQEGERSPTEEEVRDCLKSSYTANVNTETAPIENSLDNDESGVDGPVLR